MLGRFPVRASSRIYLIFLSRLLFVDAEDSSLLLDVQRSFLAVRPLFLFAEETSVGPEVVLTLALFIIIIAVIYIGHKLAYVFRLGDDVVRVGIQGAQVLRWML